MKVVIVKYNAGNVCSITHALNRLGVSPILSDDSNVILSADGVIFPGVGEAQTAMEFLKAKGLDNTLIKISRPFLGICLGMQLMCSFSEEGEIPCLGIFKETVKKFPDTEKIPHVGWNQIKNIDLNKNFLKLQNNTDMYFVHSYYVPVNQNTIATTEYILPFSAAIKKDNFYGVQFHPEKSGVEGEKILKNFISLL